MAAKPYLDLALVEERAEGPAVYHPDHLNRRLTWVIADDIMRLECFDGTRDLVVIPYARKGDEGYQGFDFMNVWDADGSWHWEKVFYTSEDPHGLLWEDAKSLYEVIRESTLDTELDPSIRSAIERYVHSGRPE